MKRCIPILLAFCLALTGCTSMLEREYLSVEPRTQFTSATVSDNVFTISNYQELLSVLLYFISTSSPSGSVGLHDYVGSVEHDLAAACLEVSTKDPLGSYAVKDIDYEVTRVVTYYDVVFSFEYSHTPEQIASIRTVVGSGAIRNAITNTFTSFGSELVLRLDYFTEDEEYLQELVAQAYYDAPQVAFGLPTATINFYPDSSQQRVVEIVFTYPTTTNALSVRANLLESLAQDIVDTLLDGVVEPLSTEERTVALYAHLRDTLLVSDQGQSTAYDALLGHEVDSEGTAMTWQLLSQDLGLESSLVVGTLNEEPHFWNIVQVGDQWRHLDLSTDIQASVDGDMMDLGYSWDVDAYPSCTD